MKHSLLLRAATVALVSTLAACGVSDSDAPAPSADPVPAPAPVETAAERQARLLRAECIQIAEVGLKDRGFEIHDIVEGAPRYVVNVFSPRLNKDTSTICEHVDGDITTAFVDGLEVPASVLASGNLSYGEPLSFDVMRTRSVTRNEQGAATQFYAVANIAGLPVGEATCLSIEYAAPVETADSMFLAVGDNEFTIVNFPASETPTTMTVSKPEAAMVAEDGDATVKLTISSREPVEIYGLDLVSCSSM